MNESQLDALVEANTDDVAFDGLYVRRDADGYAFAIDPEGHRGVEAVDRGALSEAAFRMLAREHPWFVSNWHYWTRTVGRSPRSWSETDDADGTADADEPDDEDEAVASEDERVRKAPSGDEPDRTNAPDGESHRYAFLRWIERAADLSVPERYEALADDLTRSWGQLRITAEIDESGRRRYHVRHEDDESAALADLTVHADPLDARELAKFDEKERYRPLKTAPTLPTGWAFADLDGEALLETVDAFYPATVANWHLERRGSLDVSHWAETAERQTGIYDVIDELPPAALEWVTEACCVDSQCLKRREWDRSEGDEIATPRGNGEFPCREPCSVVIAAARKWTKLGAEPTRTYEFDLTPSEKEQVEAIVDAVADGRIDEIREADVYEGANRYRARYLRAKRFDEAGNLSGTPTDESE